MSLAFAAALPGQLVASQGCVGDVAADGRVDGGDLGVLLANWGPVTSTALSRACDLNGDSHVDGADLGQLLSDWGLCRPLVLSVAPSVGSTSGGTSVSIRGNYFEAGCSVSFGEVPAASVNWVSITELTAVTPPGAVGTVGVRVAGPNGAGEMSSAFRYASLEVPAWAELIEAEADPAVVADPSLRSAIAATGYAWRVRDAATGIELLLVPPGVFSMGCSLSEVYEYCAADEFPIHEVSLTSAYYLGRYEVTQGEWVARMGWNSSLFQGAAYPDSSRRPVHRVSWNDVQQFFIGTGLRLPTEAEWERAYRAGTMTAFHGFAGHESGTNDDNLLANIGWWWLNSGDQTHPVGQRLPNILVSSTCRETCSSG